MGKSKDVFRLCTNWKLSSNEFQDVQNCNFLKLLESNKTNIDFCTNNLLVISDLSLFSKKHTHKKSWTGFERILKLSNMSNHWHTKGQQNYWMIKKMYSFNKQ